MKLLRRKFFHFIAGAAVLSASARAASAETYPARPIRLVVPFPPGGAFDTLARPWVEKMKPLLGTMVVENIGGGGSSLGAATVARAHPDGYTILLGGSLPTVNEALLKSRPLYDPFKDLDPIAGLGVVAVALAARCRNARRGDFMSFSGTGLWAGNISCVSAAILSDTRAFVR